MDPWQNQLGQGSSPRMRGKRFTLIQSLDIDGLIPAYAGKTCVPVMDKLAHWAHPRVCGENRRAA